MLGAVEYYADAEGGAYLEDPTHADLVGLIQDLDQASNTFVVFYPGDETREWFISVATRRGAPGRLRGRTPRPRHRPRPAPHQGSRGHPADIATDVLNWISQR